MRLATAVVTVFGAAHYAPSRTLGDLASEPAWERERLHGILQVKDLIVGMQRSTSVKMAGVLKLICLAKAVDPQPRCAGSRAPARKILRQTLHQDNEMSLPWHVMRGTEAKERIDT